MPAALSARRTTNRRLNDVAAALQAAPGSQGLAAPLADVDALGATTMVHPPRDHFKYLLVAPDVTLRVVVEGAGPLVVLLHGFPQGWYLWRHTIKPLVDAGFRVAAPDQRGYGMSSAPEAPEAYGLRSLTSDVVQLAKGLGHEQFYLVGHDWGCQVAWHVAALYPDSVLAVLGLDVPYTRDPSRGGVSKQLQDDPSRFWYIKEFMENADKLEAEAQGDLRAWLHSVFWALSGDSPYGTWMDQLQATSGSDLLSTLPSPPDTLPEWLTEGDLAYYVDQFSTSGIKGPMAWYRNFGEWYELSDELEHSSGARGGPQRFEMPAGFLYGSDSDIMSFDPNWEEEMPRYFKDMRMCEEVDECGHWLPLEKSEVTGCIQIDEFCIKNDGFCIKNDANIKVVNGKIVEFLQSVRDDEER